MRFRAQILAAILSLMVAPPVFGDAINDFRVVTNPSLTNQYVAYRPLVRDADNHTYQTWDDFHFVVPVSRHVISLSNLGYRGPSTFTADQFTLDVQGSQVHNWHELYIDSDASQLAKHRWPPQGWHGPWKTDPPPAVPEPSSLVLLGTGLLGAAVAVRRRLRV